MSLPALKVFRKFQSGAVTPRRILIETLQTDYRQVAIHGRIDKTWMRRLLFHHSAQDFDWSLSFERGPPGQQFIENRAETVDICRTGNRPSGGLLRRHVARGAE